MHEVTIMIYAHITTVTLYTRGHERVDCSLDAECFHILINTVFQRIKQRTWGKIPVAEAKKV